MKTSLLKKVAVLTLSLALVLFTAFIPAYEEETTQRDYPIKPVPFTQVKINSGFWYPRMKTNRDVTVKFTLKKCEETGRIKNFEVAGDIKKPRKFTGIFFNDSDVFKIIEGASYVLTEFPNKELEGYLDTLIAKIASAQEYDGYLYTARTISDPEYNYPGREKGRWSHVASGHELYNVGHMYEGAVAHYQATGKRSFLDVAIKNADLLCRTFGPGEIQLKDAPGHQQIEMGLIKLYRVTGYKRYLGLAKFFVDMRGDKDARGTLYGEYAQDHKKLVSQEAAVGHAVRGGYFYAGAADVAAILQDKKYVDAIGRIWNDVVSKKIYLTGNVGQHGAGEGYAGPYKLYNLKAYNETCAAIALSMWNLRMFLLHGEAKYIDILERSIYNGVISGVSMGGDKFFYPNPLACDMKFKFNLGNLGRVPWFDCSCCPSNIVRFLPSLKGYVYAKKDKALYVNLYMNNDANIEINGGNVKISQRTNYPWDGKVDITVDPAVSSSFDIMLRIPGWAQGYPMEGSLYKYINDKPVRWEVTINGNKSTAKLEKGYARISGNWKKGDKISLNMPMDVRAVIAHEKVEPNKGRVAFERGPIVYCAEAADNKTGSVLEMKLNPLSKMKVKHRPEMLGGVTTLSGKSYVKGKLAPITLIPYYSWNHRGNNEMNVWFMKK